MAWLTNWNYRKAITISNAGSTLSDYQVLTTIDTANLVTAGKMRSDCGDIRFTDDDGSTLLPYWIESGPNTASTNIWVKIPSVPTGTKTIYIYYGNSSVTSVSNGTNTFDYFDEGNKRTTWLNYAGISEQYGKGNPEPCYEAGSGWYAYKDVGLVPNRIVEYDTRTSVLGHFDFLSNSTGAGQAFDFDTRASPDQSNWYAKTSWTAWTLPSTTGWVPTANIWYRIKLEIGATSVKAYYSTNNGITWIDLSPTYTFNNRGTYIGLNGDGGGGITQWDNIRIRKYTSPEPTFSISVTEELSITATNMILSTNTCVGQCTITADVTWQNLGSSNVTFTPAIFINGTTIAYATSNITIGPYPATGSSTITTPTLSIGTHQICPYPN